MEYTNKPIDIKKTKVYRYIKNLIVLNEYNWYLGESKKDEYEQYFFIPKKLEQHDYGASST